MAATHSEVSAHPSSGAVTVASDGKTMEADVQRKLKLWGIIEAFRSGRLPDNEQIFEALSYAHQHSPIPLDKLSPEGRELIEDVRDIIHTMGDIVQQKNHDELIQETLYSSYNIDLSHAKQDGVIPTNKEEALADKEEAGKHLRVLATLFLTNGEVRKLTKDLGIVGRDMFATGAARAAESAMPTQEQLSQVDQPAPERQWVGPDGQILGPNDSPELQVKAADGSQVRYDPKQAPGQATVIGKDGQQTTAGEAYQNYQNAKGEAANRVTQAGQAALQGAQGARQEGAGVQGALSQGAEHAAQSQGTTTQTQGNPLMQNVQGHAQAVDAHRDPNASLRTQAQLVTDAATEHASNDPQAQNARARAQQGLDNALNKIPGEHRRRLESGANQVEEIVRDAFPKERRDQFVYRLKKVLFEVQQHKDYFEAMDWLLTSAEKYKGHGVHVVEKGNAAREAAASDTVATSTLSNFCTILERFANGQSLGPVRQNLDVLYQDARNDQQLSAWWKAVDDYVHAVLLEPGYVMEDECNEHGRALWNNGRSFFEGRYKNHWDALWASLTEWLKAFHADPLNRTFGEDWKRLTKDLLFNEDGNLTFKPKLWGDVRRVILPSLIRNIGYVPIPRAEYTDDKLDLVVENLILSGPNLFPNIVVLENHNFFQFSPMAKIKDRNHNRFRLQMSQIQCDIRDVRFAFRKKSGFPRLKDSGIADVVVARQGISIDVEVETVEDRRDTAFRVRSVDTTIDQLSFKLRDTKHDMLYKFIKGPATSIIKKALSKAVEGAIRTALEYADEQLVEIRNTIAENKDADDVTRKQAIQNMYKRKKAEAQDAKAKADANKPQGEFRIVMDRDQSMLPEMSQDASKSIAHRMWKTEDAARTSGNKGWRSPAFSIVSRNHPAVTGKHHPQAAPGAAQGQGLSSNIAQAAHEKKVDAEQSAQRAANQGRQAERVADNAANQPIDGREGHRVAATAAGEALGGHSGQQGIGGQHAQNVAGAQHGQYATQSQQAAGGYSGQQGIGGQQAQSVAGAQHGQYAAHGQQAPGGSQYPAGAQPGQYAHGQQAHSGGLSDALAGSHPNQPAAQYPQQGGVAPGVHQAAEGALNRGQPGQLPPQ